MNILRTTIILSVLALPLALAGCEQTRPPTPEGQKKIDARTAFSFHPTRIEGATPRTKVELRPQPEPPAAGQVSIWDIKVFDVRDNEDKTRKEWKFFNPLPNIGAAEDTTSVLMNMWVISDDGSVFLRSRPSYKAYGSFVTDFTLPRAGTYTAFIEYQPVYKKQAEDRSAIYPVEMASKSIQATGDNPLPVKTAWKLDTPAGTSTHRVLKSDGTESPYSCQLVAPRLAAMTRQSLNWTVIDADKKPVQVENAYIVSLSEAGELLHYRGQDPIATFPEAGIYKLWVCFELEGGQFAAPMTVQVHPRSVQKAPGQSGR